MEDVGRMIDAATTVKATLDAAASDEVCRQWVKGRRWAQSNGSVFCVKNAGDRVDERKTDCARHRRIAVE